MVKVLHGSMAELIIQHQRIVEDPEILRTWTEMEKEERERERRESKWGNEQHCGSDSS
jgi:hypothetical protein